MPTSTYKAPSLVILALASSLAGGCATTGNRAGNVEAQLAARAPSPVTIDSVPIAYHVFGRGPIVFAHPGGPGVDWRYLRMPEVEKVATVVYIEPFGSGSSGNLADPNGYTIAHYVAVVEQLRQRFGLDRIVLLGHSHGGFIAQAYALAYPQHLRGLILLDTSPTTGPDWQKDVAANVGWFAHEPWFAAAVPGLQQESTAKTDDDLTAVLRRIMPLYFFDWTGRSKEFEPLRAQIRVAAAPNQSGSAPAADAVPVAPFDVRSQLPKIATPTLIVVGTKDFICSPKMAQVIHEGIAGSRLVVLAHSGHMGHIEEPREHARAVGDFLATLAP